MMEKEATHLKEEAGHGLQAAVLQALVFQNEDCETGKPWHSGIPTIESCKMCDYFVKFDYPHKTHNCSKRKKKVSACKKCRQPFWKEGRLKLHIKRTHYRIKRSKNQVTSSHEGKQIALYKKQKNESFSAETASRGFCLMCEYFIKLNYPQTNHVCHVTRTTLYKCKRCGKPFWNNNFSVKHDKKCKGIYPPEVGKLSRAAIRKSCYICDFFAHFKFDPVVHPCNFDRSHVFVCDVCKNPFTNKRHLSQHLKSHHAAGSQGLLFQNQDCGSNTHTYSETSGLKKFVRIVCKMCEYFAKFNYPRMRHNCFKNIEIFLCERCKKPFWKDSDLKYHLKKKYGEETSNNESTPCLMCEYFAEFKFPQIAHTCRVSSDMLFTCKHCRKPYWNNDILALHEKNCTDADSSQGLVIRSQDCGNYAHTSSETSSIQNFVPVQCSMCEYFVKFNYPRESHNCFENIEIFICERCKKPFWEANNLKCHSMQCGKLKRTGGDKSAPCLMCDHLAEFKLPQRAHICHASDVLFTCKRCSKPYWNNDSLARHEKNCTAQTSVNEESQRILSVKRYDNKNVVEFEQADNNSQGSFLYAGIAEVTNTESLRVSLIKKKHSGEDAVKFVKKSDSRDDLAKTSTYKDRKTKTSLCKATLNGNRKIALRNDQDMKQNEFPVIKATTRNSCAMCNCFIRSQYPHRSHTCSVEDDVVICKTCGRPFWYATTLRFHELNCNDPSLKTQVASSQEEQQKTLSIKEEQNNLQGEMPAFHGKQKTNLYNEEISLTEKNSREKPHYALKMIKNEKEETRQASLPRKRQLEEINESNANKRKLAFCS